MEQHYLKNVRLQFTPWETLSPVVQDLFTTWLHGDESAGLAFYRLYFYWYNIPRELFRLLRVIYGSAGSNAWEEENAAHQLAIAFWRVKGQSRRLLELEKALRQVLTLLPDPVPFDQDHLVYFLRTYPEQKTQPAIYAYFQFHMLLDNLQKPREFPIALRTLVSSQAGNGDITIPLSPDAPFDEQLPQQICLDVGRTLAAYGLRLPAAQVICQYSPILTDITWLE